VTEIIALIDEFAKWLPDLKIGINTRREPRVSLPWNKIEPLRQKGAHRMTQNTPRPKTSEPFSIAGRNRWPSHEERLQETKNQRFKPWRLFQPSVFDEKVAPSCSPFSQARRNRNWNTQDFCAACALPHSNGQFLQNWTEAGDLCHQPDIGNLHGFFTGETIQTDDRLPKNALLPVFSRSKITGYNDILFPFSGDYIDNQTPDLSNKGFFEKDDKLFWRGLIISEGISFDQKWQGMQQQRLVHLTNLLDQKKQIPMLLPSPGGKFVYESLPSKDGKFVYENVPAVELHNMLEKTDIGFTNEDKCIDVNCLEQRREFGSLPAMSLSELQNYRYLFSLDKYGGPSPDFITFLRSKSVPFHASIFRSWYDDRLTPWLHFVPIDSRLQAVHSTLAYFVGVKGHINGREVQMEGRPHEGSFIADQGSKWAAKALRREDASVYAFRLLLEWGRLVDDKRDEIGYVGVD